MAPSPWWWPPPPTTSSATASRRRPRRWPSGPSPSSAPGSSAGRPTVLRASSCGWSLLIFPEGGRSADGWGRGTVAGRPTWPCAARCRWCPSTSKAPDASSARATSGPVPAPAGSPSAPPAPPVAGEHATRFAGRIEAAVATLADEARHRLVVGPPAGGQGRVALAERPRGLPSWRRTWALGERAGAGPHAGRPRLAPDLTLGVGNDTVHHRSGRTLQSTPRFHRQKWQAGMGRSRRASFSDVRHRRWQTTSVTTLSGCSPHLLVGEAQHLESGGSQSWSLRASASASSLLVW